MRLSRWAAGGAAVALTAGVLVALPGAASAVDTSSPVVINEVYGGGGNSGATYKQDFIELYNTGDDPVDLSGYSVQYASKTGTSWNSTTDLAGSIAPGGFYLIGEAVGNGGTVDLPDPDVTGDIALSGSGGKVALVADQTPLSCGGDCAAADGVVDFVGWGAADDFAGSGPAPGTDNTTSVSRDADHANTGDNAADFTADGPSPAAEGGDDDGGGGDDGDEPVEATIAEIQGDGDTSPLAGSTVVTSGVVTAAYPTGGYNGYYIQTPGTGGEIDLATHTASDAVFVYSASTVGQVAVGDHVQVTGEVSEYNQLTEISVDAADHLVQLDAAEAPLPATTETFPAAAGQRESLEGMLYLPTGDYTITDTYGTNSYGELGLAAGDEPLLQWTDVARPGTPDAEAVKADNAARAVVLDDGSTWNFLSADHSADTPPYISLTDPIRVGAPVSFDAPVILTIGGDPQDPSWRFQPTAQVTPEDTDAYPATWTNTRTATPDAGKINAAGTADFEIASFNVLNYFTLLGEDVPGCEPYADRDGNGIATKECSGDNGPRGAWDAASLQRQQDKIVAAINGSGADVAGLMEIENSVVVGEDVDHALATLVDALNADAGADTWAYVASSGELPEVGLMDVITNAIIYKPAAVTPLGDAHALGTASAQGQAFANAREPIAQVFEPTGGGEPFLLVVNHFKSKGSPGPWPGDTDDGDGQGNSNESRMRQATALRDWIPGLQETTGVQAVVMVGDYNSYSQEDPLQILYDAGYVDADHHFDVGKYSYSYSGLSGSLDHALLNDAALQRATGADIWNINSPESVALQYSRYNYHGTLFYAPDVYAASDHDPVLVGMTNTTPSEGPVASQIALTAPAAGQTFGTDTPLTVTATVTMADGSAPQGTILFRNGATDLGIASVGEDGTASFTVPADTPAGVLRITGTFVPLDLDLQGASQSDPLKFQVYKALSATTVKVRVHGKKLNLTAGVQITNSPIPAQGVVNFSVNGQQAASAQVNKNGKARAKNIRVDKGTAIVIATFLPDDPVSVQRSSSRPQIVTVG